MHGRWVWLSRDWPAIIRQKSRNVWHIFAILMRIPASCTRASGGTGRPCRAWGTKEPARRRRPGRWWSRMPSPPPVVPSSIEHHLESFYEDSIVKCFGNGFLWALQREYYKTAILGTLQDSSLYYPQPITLEGINENGLFWKLKRIGYISISYENVIPNKKNFYDFILNEYKFLTKNEVFAYKYLPLYK